MWTMLLLLGAGGGAAGSWRCSSELSKQATNFNKSILQTKNATGLYCSYCRTPSAAGKKGEFDCNNYNLQWSRCQPLEIAVEEVSTARNCMCALDPARSS